MKKQLFLMLCLAVVAVLHGQKSEVQLTIDSLLNEAWAQARSQPGESLRILGDIESFYTEDSSRYKEDVVWYYYGIFNKNLNRFEESEAYFNRYEAFHRAAKHPRLVAAVNMAKANLYSDMGDFARSMEAVIDAYRAYESVEDTAGMLVTSNKLGALYTEADRMDDAIIKLRETLELARFSGNQVQEQIAYTNLGVAYENKGDLAAAYTHYERAYQIGEAKEGDYDKVLNRYNMAHILTQMGKWEAAAPYAEACARLADSINVPDLSAASRRLLADFLIEEGEYERGISMLLPQTDSTYSMGLKDRAEAYELLVKAYRQTGDYRRGFGALEQFKTLSDSVTGIERLNRINELSAQYETEKKQQQIAMLDLENQTARAVISQKNRTITIGIVGLVLITGLSIFLYGLYRKYRRQQEQLAVALEEKEYLIKEIHHRVKNNLQIISSLLQLQARYIDEPIALEALNDGENRVRSMSIIHHHLYTGEHLSQVNLPEYVANLCSNLEASYRPGDKAIVLHQAVPNLLLDVSVMIPLGLILNELLTNAYKYAFEGLQKGNIWVSIEETGGHLLVEVKDDGVGMHPETVQKGFGSRLIRAFLRKLEAEMESSQPEKGTAIQILIPNYIRNSALQQTG
ncbi:sensor histidine kinase [Phaeodactylibacter xiamenensis]|uniref:sensor histidine kinase n=1 Tax=Phaeodactylibacter xiamenensis TaxID=1524460 RepID=UPI003CCC0F55